MKIISMSVLSAMALACSYRSLISGGPSIVADGSFAGKEGSNTKCSWTRQLRNKVMATLTSTALLTSSISPVFISMQPSRAETSSISLQEQLKMLQSQQLNAQKIKFQSDEQELVSKELLYPEGRLIARGSVALSSGNPKVNPYGYVKASDVNTIYSSDDATMFILAVGREGPPLAAKRYKLNSLQFPFVFEITSADLLFPYTEEAWLKSTNSKDTVAMTAIISTSPLLGKPADTERAGFGISEPITFAGVLTRTGGQLSVQDKVDMSLYSKEDLALLDSVDKALAEREAVPVAP